MSQIPVGLRYEGERESISIDTTLDLQKGMCSTIILVSVTPATEIQLELGRPAALELARQLLQVTARP